MVFSGRKASMCRSGIPRAPGMFFHGAYIVGLLEGMDAPECARFASAVSAIKCTCFGGRTGIPNRDTVQRFLETGEIDRTEAQRRLAYYRNNL